MEISEEEHLQVYDVQVDRNKFPGLQRNAASIEDKRRVLPKPMVIKMEVNNQPV